MTWQYRNVLVSRFFSQYSFLTVYHITDTLLYCYRLLQELQSFTEDACCCLPATAAQNEKKCARFYFGNDSFASKSNEVESRYLPEKVTSRK